MRIALLLTVVVLASVAALHAQDYIHPPYLSSKYMAPQDAPSTIVVAGKEESGDRLIVTGQATVGGKPAAGVSIYAFHADADGLYTKDGRNSDENARLHGAMRTDAEGRYRYETIRPRGYDNLPAHLHHVVNAPGYSTRMRTFWFVDDPLVVQQCKVGVPSLPEFCRPAGRVSRDSDGVWHVTYDLEMLPE
jgi:protocatechuate 3,4-dioxygenase beta subunit